MKLDVGSGGGEFETSCLGDVNIDVAKPKYKPCKPFVVCDAAYMPFRDNVFFQTTMFDVVEHVDSPVLVLREIKRVLTVGGVMVLGTPNAVRVLNFLFLFVHNTYIPHEDHVQTWGVPELTNLMYRVGFRSFTVKACTYGDSKHGLLARLALFLSLRSQLNGRQLLVVAKK